MGITPYLMRIERSDRMKRLTVKQKKALAVEKLKKAHKEACKGFTCSSLNFIEAALELLR